MMKILKLNSISSSADAAFAGYEYSDSVRDPDGIILRSYAMHDYPLGDGLLAVARAGAGVNNIPVDACTCSMPAMALILSCVSAVRAISVTPIFSYS